MTYSASYHVTLSSIVISALEENLTISIEGNTHQEKITYHFKRDNDVKKDVYLFVEPFGNGGDC